MGRVLGHVDGSTTMDCCQRVRLGAIVECESCFLPAGEAFRPCLRTRRTMQRDPCAVAGQMRGWRRHCLGLRLGPGLG